MNKAEERQLEELARTAKALRKTIDSADSMLRSWARHRKEAGTISLYLTDRRVSRWRCNVNLPAEIVQTDLVPILKRIRSEATERLRALRLKMGADQ